ncbi:MAG: ATP-dependent metallopeptidase FtsH/Yme1/Tma family protein, partial [Bacteroidales bacterium]|nr:ATP-dependent metallopeptidase FtsH/Yme1/Tma family protein [Bacteroidales bacterium]
MENQPKPGGGNLGSNRKPQGGKRRNFNIYWIYGLLLLILLYLQFSGGFGGVDFVKTTWHDVEGMLKRGDVEKIVVVNGDAQDRSAEIFIKPEKIYENDIYEPLRSTGGREGNKHYVLTFVSIETFEKDVRMAQQEAKEADTVGQPAAVKKQIMERPDVELVPETRRSFWENGGVSFLFSLLLTVLFIVLLFR